MPSVNGPEKECVATQILRQLPLADKTSVWGTLGTIRPHLSFDVEKDVQTLLGTVSGRGVDYRTIIDLLTNRSNEQCQQIAKEFLDFTKQDLLTTLQAAVPANLEGFVAGLLRPAAQYDAHEIKAALKVQRLARRSRPPLATSHHPALRLDWGAGVWSARARHFPGCPTVVARQPHAPSSSPSSRGHQKRVWSWTRLGSRPCCASNRRFALPRPPITPLLDFVILFLTCQITHILWGPEVETLTEILCTRTNQQLREILRFYKNDFKSDFEKDVASGTSGWLKDLLVALSQGKRERYSGVIDYILIDQDTKVRYGLCGEVGRASVFARPVEGRPSPAEKRFPCSVKYRRCDKLRAKKLWGSSEERRRTQNSLRTKRALVDADGGGHAGKLQESEWVRILTQRSPEHLNRGKTASAMPRIALSICCERGEVVFSHVGILCNRFKWTRNEFPRNLESRTPDVALLLNQLACDVGTIFFLGTWELLNSNLVLFEAHPMWQTDISLLAEEIHKVFLVSRLRLWSDKTKRIPCLLETRSVQLAG
ncbi:annexin A9 isoform X2 [Varanus komodoensis]|nr:annexin A9 isoform X2 [Varanus komodoensis]XP_044305098.1 annexin A9 isoform X2 [Varanus komodoensis]